MTEGLLGAIKRVLLMPYYLFIAAIVAPIGMAFSAHMEEAAMLANVRMGQTAQSHQFAEGIA